MQYRYENSAIIALGQGAVVVGAPIAQRLHCTLGMFLTEDVAIPGENVSVGTVSQGGGFVYSKELTEGQAEDYYSEFHNYIDDQRREKTQRLNRLMINGGALDVEMLKEHVVIVVSDGLRDSTYLEAIADFLKPIKINRLIIVTPVAAVAAVDRMHILADELHCLNVTDNYIETAHYYDVNDIPTHEQAISIINNNILNWI